MTDKEIEQLSDRLHVEVVKRLLSDAGLGEFAGQGVTNYLTRWQVDLIVKLGRRNLEEAKLQKLWMSSREGLLREMAEGGREPFLGFGSAGSFWVGEMKRFNLARYVLERMPAERVDEINATITEPMSQGEATKNGE